MALTSNTFTGDGSTTNYSFTFEYLEQPEVKVTLDGVATTAFTFANATTLSFTTAPNSGTEIRIYRETNIETLKATFFPGSAIKAEDLNNNFTQNLYVTQESNQAATQAITTADAATATANTALSNSSAAVSTANAASASAAAAVSTANTASSNASAAVSTANTASSNASAAVSTANSANTKANTAIADSASAVITANNAEALANSALGIVAGTVQYVPVANVAAIPGSPNDSDAVQVQDSAGIQSFTPLTGLPAGFVGSPQLFVRLQYSASSVTWQYNGYGANDPDSRYAIQGVSGSASSPSYYFDANTGFYSPGADQVAVATNGTGRLFVDASGRLLLGTSTNPTGVASDFYINNTSGGSITLVRNATPSVPGNLLGLIQFSDQAGGVGARIQASAAGAWTTGSTSESNLIFLTTPAGATTPTERLRITSAGLVGIGTSSPGQALTVARSGLSNQNLSFDVSGTGNGIISSSDSSSLKDLTISNTSTSKNIIIKTTNSSAVLGTSVVVNGEGRVGIGTTSPSETLEVAGNTILDASNATLKIKQGGTGTTGAIDFTLNSDSTSYGSLNLNFDDRETQGLRLNTAYPLTLECGAVEEILFKRATTESARIDSGGRLLVGTATARTATVTPFLQLETSSGSDQCSIGLIRNTNNDGEPRLILAKTRGTANGANTLVANNDRLGTIQFNAGNGTDIQSIAGLIKCEVDGTPAGPTPGPVSMPGRLVFSTTANGASSPTERMRINSTGRTDTFGTSETLRVRTAATTASASIAIRLQAGATSIATGGTTEFQVTSDGNVQNTNNSYGAISDIKLKENIVDASSQWDDLKALQVRNYNFKEGQTHTQIGLVAQEVERVSPGLVSESPDRDEDGNDLGTVTKSVNYSVLYMKAVKALQEAMERIDTLEAKVAAIETP